MKDNQVTLPVRKNDQYACSYLSEGEAIKNGYSP